MAAIVTTTVVVAFCVPLAVFMSSVAYDRAVDSAELQSRSLAAELVAAHDVATVERLVDQGNGAAQTAAVVYLSTGQVVGPGTPPREAPVRVAGGQAATTNGPSGSRLVWEPVRGHSLARAVMVTVPASLLGQGVARDWLFVFGGGALLVVIAVALADRLGRTIVRPIQALERTTRKLRDGELGARVVPAGPVEVTEVGRTVNELADRIDELVGNARIAAADLGHRLRTPLTSLRLDVEAVPAGAARRTITRDLDALERAVDNLIRETRQAPRTAGRTDLVDAVRRRMAFWGVLAVSQHRALEVDLPALGVEVALARDELEADIDALLSNIFAHTPEGTAFRVSVEPPSSPEGEWLLSVEDQGRAGVAAPGRSSETGGRGTGLGLDIVRRSVARGGGSVGCGVTPSGGWLVEVRFPGSTATEGDRPPGSARGSVARP